MSHKQLEAIRYDGKSLSIIDQLLLPHESVYIDVTCMQDAHRVIKSMQVRGAPAIAMVACLALALELKKHTADKAFKSNAELTTLVVTKMSLAVAARPTAVNVANAKHDLLAILGRRLDVQATYDLLMSYCESMLEKDRAINKSLGDHGCKAICALYDDKEGGEKTQKLNVLTHCNTGSLATAGYGTALGIIRSLHAASRLHMAYADETRPYMQGARLTVYELDYEDIPVTLIADSMAAALMKKTMIHAVLVGCDNVARNGDTANKIGTYSLAVLARAHSVPFYVAMPSTTYNPSIETGDDIVIEERPADELTSIGSVRVAREGTKCWNPAFDVTPNHLITAFVSEYGVFKAEELHAKYENGWK